VCLETFDWFPGIENAMSSQPVTSVAEVEWNQNAISGLDERATTVNLAAVDGEQLGSRRIHVGALVAQLKVGIQSEFDSAHRLERSALIKAAGRATEAVVRNKWTAHWEGAVPLAESFDRVALEEDVSNALGGSVYNSEEALRQVARLTAKCALGQVNVWAAERQAHIAQTASEWADDEN